MDLSNAKWVKSSHSGTTGGDCVEVATNLPDIVAIRDSKNPTGPALIVSKKAWSAFLTAVRQQT